MKSLLVLILFLSFSPIHAEVIKGCEGEGCGCTNEPKTNKDITLYKEMDTKSKVLGKFKSGTKAKFIEFYMKVTDPGKAKVVSVTKTDLGLATGDIVTYPIYLGESFYKVKHQGKWIEFEKPDQIDIEITQQYKYEQWGELKVGKLKGYVTGDFPFHGCLE